MSEGGRHYRLRGAVDGADTFFTLRRGENRIGRAADSEVLLTAHGVSRLHAVVRVDDDGVEVEDRGSKNGVLVDGRRVERERLAPGARLGLGSASLVLETVDPGDAALAITLPTGAPREALADDTPGPTSDVTAVTPALRLLRLVEVFAGRASNPGGLGSALSELCAGLEATGACVLEWDEGEEPSVLAASGRLGEPPISPRLASLLETATARAAAAAPGTTFEDGSAATAVAVSAPDAGRRRALAVVGCSDGHPEVELLLRTLLRLVAGPSVAGPAARPGQKRALRFPPDHLPCQSAAMRSLYDQMAALVQGDLPVLIAGETGVGKEHLARCLHLSSARRDGPFVAINCAAIPAELLEAEMFGVVKGAATGVSERPGKFELADGGTLLLDELGDMPLELQAKLLRALQEKEIQPVGGTPVKVDLRIVSATNADLLRHADSGRFRRDLYYRIAGYVLLVPPLRERAEDLPALVEEFVRRCAVETGKSIRGVSVRAVESLTRYPWPGNVRELEHEVRRMVYLCPDGRAIDSGMLSPHLTADPQAGTTPDALGDSLLLEHHVAALEARLIREALARSGGNQSRAAQLLGISRNGLAHKLKRLEPSRGGSPED